MNMIKKQNVESKWLRGVQTEVFKIMNVLKILIDMLFLS